MDLIDYINKEVNGINVISLFNGMSVGSKALQDAGIPVKKYYVSEIDKYANAVTKYLNPNHIMLGDVTKWREWDIDWKSIDFVIAGSPCQGFSFAGKQLNFDDPRSALFFDFVDIYKHAKKHNSNCKFFLENVKMKKEYSDIITNTLGHGFDIINSSLLTAQNRVRLYWADIDLEQPKDLGIVLKDILQDDGVVDDRMTTKDNKAFYLTARYQGAQLKNSIERKQRTMVKCAAQRGRNIVNGVRKDIKGAKTEQRLEVRSDDKTNCLTTVQKDNLIVQEATKKGYTEIKPGDCVDLTFPNSKTRRDRNMQHKSNCLTAAKYDYCRYTKDFTIRRLTPVECERLQGLPDNYTKYGIDDKGKLIEISDTQRYKMLGNGWTLPVITHIFKQIFNERINNE